MCRIYTTIFRKDAEKLYNVHNMSTCKCTVSMALTVFCLCSSRGLMKASVSSQLVVFEFTNWYYALLHELVCQRERKKSVGRSGLLHASTLGLHWAQNCQWCTADTVEALAKFEEHNHTHWFPPYTNPGLIKLYLRYSSRGC